MEVRTVVNVGLGTAQFGLDYGISNGAGRVSAAEVRSIIHSACERGVTVLDSAAAYGAAESLLGESLPPRHNLRIITKLPPLPEDLPSGAILQWAIEALTLSMRRLRCDHVDGLLIHRTQDLLGRHGPELYRTLRDLRDQGVVRGVGASVYSGAEIDDLLTECDLDLVQLPISVLDHRLIAGGQLSRLKARRVEVHARSLFLQGLLLMKPRELPSPFFDQARPVISAFRNAAGSVGLSPVAAAVGFAQAVAEIDCAIFGVTRVAELVEILDAVACDPLPLEWYTRFALDDENIVNPSRWPETPS